MVVGWGIPAALISICVGFKYEEYGGEVYFPSLLRVNVFPLLVILDCRILYSHRILDKIPCYSIIAGSVQIRVFSTFN